MVWQAEAEDIVLPATDGREIRLRRVTEPDLGIVVRRFDVRWEKLQLLCFAVVVELNTSMVFSQRACADEFNSPR
jgi:hypothetical protein